MVNKKGVDTMKKQRIMIIEDDIRNVQVSLYNDGTYSIGKDNVTEED